MLCMVDYNTLMLNVDRSLIEDEDRIPSAKFLPYHLYVKSNPGLLGTHGDVTNPRDWYHSNSAKNMMKNFADKYNKIAQNMNVSVSFNLGPTAALKQASTSEKKKSKDYFGGLSKVSEYDTKVLIVKEMPVPEMPKTNRRYYNKHMSESAPVKRSTEKSDHRTQPKSDSESVFLPRVSRQTIVLKSGTGFHRHMRVSHVTNYDAPKVQEKRKQGERKELPEDYSELKLPQKENIKIKDKKFKETFLWRQKSQLNIKLDHLDTKKNYFPHSPPPKLSNVYKKKFYSDRIVDDESAHLSVFPTLPSAVPNVSCAEIDKKHHIYTSKDKAPKLYEPQSASIVTLPPATETCERLINDEWSTSGQRKRPYDPLMPSVDKRGQYKIIKKRESSVVQLENISSVVQLENIASQEQSNLKSPLTSFKKLEVFEKKKSNTNDNSLFHKRENDKSEPLNQLQNDTIRKSNSSPPSNPRSKPTPNPRPNTVISQVNVPPASVFRTPRLFSTSKRTGGSPLRYRSHSLRSFSSKLKR